MPSVRNDERRTTNDERPSVTDGAKNLSLLTSTSVTSSMGSTPYAGGAEAPPSCLQHREDR